MTTSLSAGVSARSRARSASSGRAARSSSPTASSRRSARSGTRRSRAAPRSCTCRGRDGSRSRSSASPRRSTRDEARLDHAVCYRNGARLDVEADRRRSRTSAARSVLLDAYQSIGTSRSTCRRSASTSSPPASSSTCSARPGSGSSTAAASSSSRRLADGDRLVRRRERLRDGHPRLLAGADARRFQSGTPPVPAIYAGIAGIELMQEIGDRRDAASTSPAERAPDRRASTSSAASSRRRAIRTAAARSSASARPTLDALVAELAREGIVTSSRDGNLRVSPARVQHARGHQDGPLGARAQPRTCWRANRP